MLGQLYNSSHRGLWLSLSCKLGYRGGAEMSMDILYLLRSNEAKVENPQDTRRKTDLAWVGRGNL